MSGLTLREIARAMGGEVQGQQVVCPGPGHSRIDRSLAVRLSSQHPTGWVAHSYVGDDFTLCRDFIAQRLGLDLDAWRTRGHGAPRQTPTCAVREPAPEPDHAARIARALAIWNAGTDAHGTCVERYLASRGLDLPVGTDALRFNPRTPWREDNGEVVRVPAMVACLRAIEGDGITGVHKTRLTREGVKVGRKMQGLAGGSAVKLDPDDAVTMGLAIGEGIETCLAARQLGLRPCWALASAGAVASFPLLAGVEALTLLAENDPASDRAIGKCAEAWHVAGREVTVVTPNFGSDLADVIGGVA